MQRYFKIWVVLISNSIQVSFASKFGAILFIIAKLLRFGFFLLTLFFITEYTQVLAGYTREEVFFIFLTYTVVDTLAQLIFREVYRFRPKVVSGDFDLDLIKPLPSLFRPLFGGLDVFDAITLIPYGLSVIWIGSLFHPSSVAILWYILLLINAVILSASFHILVLALGIMTTEIDHAIMMYRDITSMGRFPVDMYGGILKNVLTFIIPVGVMVTLPVQVVTRSLDTQVLWAFLLSAIFLYLSLQAWNLALRKYSSASS